MSLSPEQLKAPGFSSKWGKETESLSGSWFPIPSSPKLALKPVRVPVLISTVNILRRISTLRKDREFVVNVSL